MESDDAILALAVRACGHGIGRHDEDGCPGAQATFCVCTLTPAVALDAAIERVRYAGRRCSGVRAVEPATMIALLGARLIRSQ